MSPIINSDNLRQITVPREVADTVGSILTGLVLVSPLWAMGFFNDRPSDKVKQEPAKAAVTAAGDVDLGATSFSSSAREIPVE